MVTRRTIGHQVVGAVVNYTLVTMDVQNPQHYLPCPEYYRNLWEDRVNAGTGNSGMISRTWASFFRELMKSYLIIFDP